MELITLIVIIATSIVGFFLFILSLCEPIKNAKDDLGFFLSWLFCLIATSAGTIYLIVRLVKYIWLI